VAIVVPDHDVLPKYAKNKLNITGNMKQLCADPVSIIIIAVIV
jgi:hypothetical protein